MRSDAARAAGARLGSAGTHPFSLFERQSIMPRDRYRALIDQLQYAGRRELIYGLHVHVAVGDPDRAIRIVNALRAHLCELVALSANSPFWRGEPTGFASCRHLIFSAFPRSGPPPHFRSYEEYADVIAQLVAAGCIEDYTRTWWDVRPHPKFGTVEVRVMDAVTRVEDAIALAAYVQALVRRYDERRRRPPAIRCWRARTSGAPRATGSTARSSTSSHGGAMPIRDRHRAHAGRARARTRVSSAASASSTASSGSCATATAPPTSSRRAATPARPRARSQPEGPPLGPRRCRSAAASGGR